MKSKGAECRSRDGRCGNVGNNTGGLDDDVHVVLTFEIMGKGESSRIVKPNAKDALQDKESLSARMRLGLTAFHWCLMMRPGLQQMQVKGFAPIDVGEGIEDVDDGVVMQRLSCRCLKSNEVMLGHNISGEKDIDENRTKLKRGVVGAGCWVTGNPQNGPHQQNARAKKSGVMDCLDQD
jgi:hypothetical protein